MRRSLTGVLAATLFTAAPVAAQGHGHPPAQGQPPNCPAGQTCPPAGQMAQPGAMGAGQNTPGMQGMHGGGMMGGGMMGMMGGMGMMEPGPMMILRLREPLELTDAQAQRIQQIGQRTQQEQQRHRQLQMQAQQEAVRILQSDSPDLARYEAQLRAAAGHEVEARVAMARAFTEARQALNPQQRQNLAFGLRAMHEMMSGGMMGGGMMMQGNPAPSGQAPRRP